MKILEIENRKNSRNGKEQVIKKQKENFPGLKKHELKLFITFQKTYSLIFFFNLTVVKFRSSKIKRKS